MTPPDSQPVRLHQIRALVTRPQNQGAELAERIQQQNGHAYLLPMLEVKAIPETQTVRQRILALDRYDKVIVISRHAAQFGLEQIENYWPQLPVGQQWFAIGETTRQTLSAFGVAATRSGQGSDSESLLSLTTFGDLSGQSVLILKGQGGRKHLENTLLQRHAQVDTIDVYQRTCPLYDPDRVRQILSEHGINVILAGSGETVQNLHRYLPLTMVEDTRLVVPSQRVAQLADELGFHRVYIANGADHGAMLSVLESIHGELSL